MNEWTLSAERLPEPGRKVLCCGVRGGMYIGEILTGLGKPEWYVQTKENPNPIAWMYLPEPYRKEDK